MLRVFEVAQDLGQFFGNLAGSTFDFAQESRAAHDVEIVSVERQQCAERAGFVTAITLPFFDLRQETNRDSVERVLDVWRTSSKPDVCSIRTR